MANARIQSFSEFWPYYIGEHRLPVCRGLHYFGTSVAVLTAITAAITGTGWLVPLALVFGYGPAWVGHFFFEKNRPATYTHPVYSFMGDWVMWKDMLTGKIPF